MRRAPQVRALCVVTAFFASVGCSTDVEAPSGTGDLDAESTADGDLIDGSSGPSDGGARPSDGGAGPSDSGAGPSDGMIERTLIDCAPTLRSPNDESTTLYPYINFTWAAGACEPGQIHWYEIELATDAAFSNVLVRDHNYIARWVPVDGLNRGSYYWRVRGVSVDGSATHWTAPFSLHIRAPAAVFDIPAEANRAAIQTTFDQAMSANGGALVRFAAGATYELSCPAGQEYCLNLDRARDVQIDGADAVLIITSPVHGVMSVRNSENLVVRDLSIDYSTLPYSQGRVVAIDPGGNYIDVELLPGMPDMLATHMVQPQGASGYPKWSKLLDPNRPGAVSERSGNVYSAGDVQRLASRTFRVMHRSVAQDARLGDIFHKQARINGRPVFLGSSSRGLVLSGLKIFASPAGVIAGPKAHGIVFVRSEVRVKEGRYISVDADVMHLRSNTLGPWVEESLFWGGLDDYVNLRPNSFNIVSRNGNSITLSQSPEVAVGETVSIYRFDDGAVTERNVVAVAGSTLTLDGPPGNGTILYGSNDAAPDAVYRYNTFRGGLRYGLLARSVRLVVDSNVFERTGGAAVSLENHPWRSDEGLAPRTAYIVNNRFDDVLRNEGSALTAIFKCDAPSPTNCSRALSEVARAARDVHFIANEFSNWRNKAIHLYNTTSSSALCNHFTAPRTGATDSVAIDVAHSSDVTLESNRLDESLGYTAISTNDVSGLSANDNGTNATLGCPVASTRRGMSAAPSWP